MATTAGGIAFEELEGSPKLRIAEQGSSAVRRFRVAWADYDAFVAELAGYYKAVGGQITFTPPMPFPGRRANFLVETVDVEPFAPDKPDGSAILSLTSGLNAYPSAGALVTAQYKQRFGGMQMGGQISIPNGTYLTYSADLGMEAFTVPGRAWKWPDSTKLKDDTPVSIFDPTTTHTLSWHRVYGPPVNAISNARGCVNDATFCGKAAKTMLFLGAKISIDFRYNDTTQLYRLDYTFAERSHLLHDGTTLVGWNHFFNEKKDGSSDNWQQVVEVDSGIAPFRLYDMTQLFQFQIPPASQQ